MGPGSAYLKTEKPSKETTMKIFRTAAMGVLVFAAVSGWAQSDAKGVLDRFKSMAGTWSGKGTHGETSGYISRWTNAAWKWPGFSVMRRTGGCVMTRLRVSGYASIFSTTLP